MAASIAALLLMGGCAVGPDFERPALPPHAGYSARPLPAETTSTSGPAGSAQAFAPGRALPGQWWTLFHSAPLDALIDAALRRNPDLAAAQAALREARENVAAARGAFLPSISGSLQATRERASDAAFGVAGGSSLYDLYNASVSVSYVPDIFGSTRRQVEAYEAQADYQRFQLEATYLSLTANLATAAIQEASLRAQIAATEAIIRDERDQLAVVRQQFILGATARSDVLAQEATLSQTEATLPPLRKQLAAERTLIAAYAGRFPSEEASARFTLDGLKLPEKLPVSLPSSLVEQRPDIRAAEAQLHEASAQVGVAVAAMLPQLQLTGSYGNEGVDIGNLFNPGNVVWNVAAGLTQPIFEGGKLLHQKRAAEAAFDQAAAQYRSTVLTAFRNVADALHAIETDAQALAAEAAAERAAGDSLALARRQYELGAIPYPTLLDAQRTYQQARLSLVQAQASRFADTAALFQALGGGWWNRDDLHLAAAGGPQSP